MKARSRHGSAGGERVFVTGGASGLGLAMARVYARRGARVLLGDVHDERGTAAADELAAVAAERGGAVAYRRCDVTRLEDLQAAAEALDGSWGGVDVVVNNAGVATTDPIERSRLEDWQWILDINLLGVVRGCRVFAPILRRQGRGRIINVASLAGLVHPPSMGAYNATKAAVVALSETLRLELADAGVDVAVACPSFFRTNLGESLRSSDEGARTMLDKLFARGKLDADEVAARIVAEAERGAFHLLPHGEGRTIFRLKRYLPTRWYLALMIRRTRGMRR